MIDDTCPTCGQGTLQKKHGTFRMEVPPNVPNGPIEVTDADWRQCDGCGEQILPRALTRAIEAEVAARLRNDLLAAS